MAICRADASTCALCTKILHDRKILQRPSTSAKAVLVIVGPKQIVERDAQGRYRSLVRVLPSVPMKCLGAHLERRPYPFHKLLVRDCNTSSSMDAKYQELRVMIAGTIRSIKGLAAYTEPTWYQ
jgi:hypothetical protein